MSRRRFIFVLFCLIFLLMSMLHVQRKYQSVKNIRNISVNDRRTQRKLELALQGHINTLKHYEHRDACEWPPVGLHGREKLNITKYPFKTLQKTYFFMKGGHYTPSCTPYQKIAIVVPYRDRVEQLKVFFNNVIPRIVRQKQEFVIYIVEQSDNNPFNRGMLANIGYQNAKSDRMFDCIVIHDVDILPEDDRNVYFCSNKSVYHLAAKMDRLVYNGFAGGIVSLSMQQYNDINGHSNQFWGWGGEDDDFMNRLVYNGFDGEIVSLSMQQYNDINGHSNQFWGWGGEDDDFMNRISSTGYNISRPLFNFSHCGEVAHERPIPNKERFNLLTKLRNTYKVEGLRTLQYELLKKEEKDLFVWLLVKLHM